MRFLVSQVRLDLIGRVSSVEKTGVVSEAIGNVWASGAVFTATIGAGRELWVGISRVKRKFS